MKSNRHFWLCCALAILFNNALYALQEHTQLLKAANDAICAGKYTQAITTYKKVLHDFPEHSELLGNIGYAYKKLRDYQSAIEWYQRAIEYDPGNARLLRGISHAYLMIGDFKNGWPAYEYRWIQPPAYNAEFISFMHSGDNVKNKTIIIHSEYGLGDVLQFIRYAQLLHAMGATIIVQSHERLAPLLSLCPYIDHILLPNDALPEHHFRVLVMSLPLAFNTTIETIPKATQPYLYADQDHVDYWKHKIKKNGRYNIGICWQANMHLTSDNQTVCDDAMAKSLPVELLRTIASIPNIRLYSLQKDVPVQLRDAIDFPIIFFDDFDTTHGAFMDSAALIKNLDLVITIDTVTAHLAGGLGVRTWLLLPYHADWRWLENIDHSPWYPKMKLFRQPKAGDWETVIQNVLDELDAVVFSK